MGQFAKTEQAGTAAEAMKNVLNSVDIGILRLDPILRPRFANTRFFEIWGTHPADPREWKTVDELFARGGTAREQASTRDDWTAFAADHAPSVRSGNTRTEPLRFPDGALVLCGCYVAPGGGRLITYTDITSAVRREVDEALSHTGAELRFRGDLMETHATDLATLAEAADESARRVEVARRELEAKLRELATIDGLTGALNRAACLAGCQRELDREREAGRGLALLMIDVDHFKCVNDRYGHPGGDAALRHLASTLRSETRRGDLLGRLGGEEFAIGLPGAPLAEAEAIAERLVAKVGDSPASFEGRSIHMTVSIGLAIAGRQENAVDQVLGRADVALYRAKGSGRNRAAIDRRADAA